MDDRKWLLAYASLAVWLAALFTTVVAICPIFRGWYTVLNLLWTVFYRYILQPHMLNKNISKYSKIWQEFLWIVSEAFVQTLIQRNPHKSLRRKLRTVNVLSHISCKSWSFITETHHEKICLCHMQTTKLQISPCIADQPTHPCTLISVFVVCCLDSIIPILAKAEISRLAYLINSLYSWAG